MRGKAKGFTLIEVLIAGSIMFIVLVMVTDSFLTARNSARHADNIIAMLEPVYFVREDIKRQLSLVPGENKNGGGIVGEVQFSWQAIVTEKAAPPPRFDLEANTTTEFAEKFYLYQIDLTLQIHEQHKTLSYNELIWRNN